MAEVQVFRVMRRAVMFVLVTSLVVLGWAAPGWAHVEVEADKPQAGATDVTVTFTAESESNSAGIASLQVVLPEGIAPTEVTYVSGPSGWALTPTADGFQVSGPALAVGRDAQFSVRIAQFPPTSATLTFKTLQNYTDGRVDRWIDIPTPQVPDPDMPAPTLTVTGAVAATTAPPTTAAPTTAAGATTSAGGQSATVAAAEPSNANAGWWIALAAVVLIALLAVGLLLRRRRQSP